MEHSILNRLQKGETFVTSSRGNSMSPIIKPGQKYKIEPCTVDDCIVGDIVYCKVHGSYYTHLVRGKNSTNGVLIANTLGRENGWTKQVYGKVIEIL